MFDEGDSTVLGDLTKAEGKPSIRSDGWTLESLLSENQKLVQRVIALEATSAAQDRIINNLMQHAVNLKMEALIAASKGVKTDA